MPKAAAFAASPSGRDAIRGFVFFSVFGGAEFFVLSFGFCSRQKK
jgi:hypothetical protein